MVSRISEPSTVAMEDGPGLSQCISVIENGDVIPAMLACEGVFVSMCETNYPVILEEAKEPRG